MGLKPVGSEKLTGDAKLKRIMDIATYGLKKDPVKENKYEYIKEAKNGQIFAIVKEKDGYHVKTGLNESTLDYVDGIDNKNKNRFSSYSAALKRVNLMLKPINESTDGVEDSVLSETKYVLKKDKPADAEMSDMGDAEPASDDVLDLDMGDEELGGDDALDLDMGDEELDLGTEDPVSDEDSVPAEPQEDLLKKIQKLTGKLGQSLREYETEIQSKDIKYVLNSIISAIDLTKLEDTDLEDVMENFEELENFEVEGGTDPMGDEDLDLGDEDLDLDLGDEDEELNEFDTLLDEFDLEEDDDMNSFDRLLDEIEVDLEEDDEYEIFDRLNENKLSKTIDNILSKYNK